MRRVGLDLSQWFAVRMGWLALVALSCVAEADSMRSPAEPLAVDDALPRPGSEAQSGSAASPGAEQPLLSEPLTGSSRRDLSFDLAATETVAQHLKPVEVRRYDQAEFEVLREKLRSMSAPVCGWLRGIHSRDAAAERAYFYRPGLFVNGALSSKYGAISGCWNYVRMNDRRPDRELDLVKALFPAASYECVAVGVMQPYLLHDKLTCRSLSIVDFDWRVHDLHAQLIALANRRQLRGIDDLQDGLRTLTTSWLALREVNEAEQSVQLDDLCSNTMRPHCERALLKFLRTPAETGRADGSGAGSLQEVHLLLASLHDAPYPVAPKDAIYVFYFSNALEPMYTSPAQSKELRTRLSGVLTEGRRGLLIHHAGGREEFGIYEAWNDGAGLEVRTVCRDPYPETRKGHKATHYTIELDRVASKGPTCSALLRERG